MSIVLEIIRREIVVINNICITKRRRFPCLIAFRSPSRLIIDDYSDGRLTIIIILLLPVKNKNEKYHINYIRLNVL